MLNVIGFTGKKRSGKDTCGGFLSAHHNYKKVHFASALKELGSKLTGMPYEVFDHPILKQEKFEKPVALDEEFAEELLAELPITNHSQANKIRDLVIGFEFNTWRKFLQFIGTDVVRDCVSTTYWVDQGIQKIKDQLELGNKVAVCDVRFENEVEAVRSLGGKVFRVTRETKQEEDNHASESIDYEVDGELDNNLDFDHLQKQLFEKAGV